MSHHNPELKNFRPSDTPKRAGTFLVATSLIIGVAIAALLLVLRARTHQVSPPLAQVSPDLPSLQKFSTAEMQSWIVSTLKSSKAKVGVVNVWATWCGPCRDEMPELAKFQKTGIAPVFLISADNEVDDSIVRKFLAESGVGFESALVKGDQQAFVEHWQKLSAKNPANQWSMTLPATFLVNSAGDVISFSIGTTTALGLEKRVKNTLDTMRD